MASQRPSPSLLGLPREIRDQVLLLQQNFCTALAVTNVLLNIYEDCFVWKPVATWCCTVGSPLFEDDSDGETVDSYWGDNNDDKYDHFDINNTTGFPSLGMLRVNRQIRDEAVRVLLTKNRFIYIKTNSARTFSALANEHDFHILEAAREGPRGDALANFIFYTMTIDLAFPNIDKTTMKSRTGREVDDSCHIIMVDRCQMFKHFVKGIASCEQEALGYRPIEKHKLQINVTLCKPYGDAMPARKVHESMISTIIRYWWLIPGFSLSGFKSPKATKDVTSMVRGKRFASVRDYARFLEDEYDKVSDLASACVKPRNDLSIISRLNEGYISVCEALIIVSIIDGSGEVVHMTHEPATVAAKISPIARPSLRLLLIAAQLATKLDVVNSLPYRDSWASKAVEWLRRVDHRREWLLHFTTNPLSCSDEEAMASVTSEARRRDHLRHLAAHAAFIAHLNHETVSTVDSTPDKDGEGDGEGKDEEGDTLDEDGKIWDALLDEIVNDHND